MLGARKRTSLPLSEILPRGLEARMIPGVQRHRFAEREDTAVRHLGNREARMGAANIDGDEPGHSPASASIADPPCSAPSA